MLQPSRGKLLLCHLKTFLDLEGLKSCFAKGGGRVQFSSNIGEVEVSKWRKLDSRNLGLARSMISIPSWIVLKNLRAAGHEAYLVGGCVRDLLLNKIPKDFDVITTAKLKQVKKKFPRAIIVGKRFPICRVTVKGSVVEVSSFGTTSEASKKRPADFSQKPTGCDPRDFLLWKNCMNRDFTVNSLIFDPFVNVIFDYTNALMDLRSLKLRTVIPAYSSFKEDTARILRGLRLAARLNLSFSKETEAAVNSLSSSVASLDRFRISLEMHYMLSYGAAAPSLILLKRFNVLEILLPFHAAYLSGQVDNQLSLRSLMIMKLFFNLDQLITCDRPCHDSLWVAMLAFHMALLNNPQHAVVLSTFASVLYHGTWEESIKFARQNAPAMQIYVPEMLDSLEFLSGEEIAERVVQFAGEVEHSLNVLISSDCLSEAMTRFPKAPPSAMVFVSKNMGKQVKHIFSIFSEDVTSLKSKRKSPEIHHTLLTEGNAAETRFVLGKIILDTLAPDTVAEIGPTNPKKEKIPQPSNPPQKPKILQQFHHTSRKPDSVSGNKSEMSTGSAGMKRSFEDSGIAADMKTSDSCRRRLGPDNVLKDENVKSHSLQSNKSSLSSLFKRMQDDG